MHMANKSPLVVSSGLVEQLQPADTLDVVNANVSALTNTHVVYAAAGGALTSSDQFVIGAARPTLTDGVNVGFTTATVQPTSYLTNLWLARQPDNENLMMLDYMDEFAYIHKKSTTLTLLPAPDVGTVDSCFLDDAGYVQWNTGTSPGTSIVLEVIPSAAIPARSNGTFCLGLVLRWSSAANPTHALIEVWNHVAGAYTTVFNAAITWPTNSHQWLSGHWGAPNGTVYRLRLTLTVANPLPSNLRIQRVALYHNTHTLDPWHLHIGGGTMYGNIALGSAVYISSAAQMQLVPGGTGGLTLGTGGNARGQYAVDLQLLRALVTQVASGYGSVVAGARNTASASYSTVIGGYTNTVSGAYGTISGGYNNIVAGAAASIGGGDSCTSNGSYSTVSGGRNNVIPSTVGSYVTIGGGYDNVIAAGSTNNGDSLICGGREQDLSGQRCTIGGGYRNNVSNAAGCLYSTIVGGRENVVSVDYSTVVSGYLNTITGGNYNVIIGGYSSGIAGGTGSFVGGGDSNTIPVSCGNYNTIGGGYSNTIIAAATNNGNNVIAGGSTSSIQGAYCVISGGRDNDITLAAGAENAAIVGGFNNTVTATGGYIGCGYTNTVSGEYAAILTGVENTASGEVSVASGRAAQATRHGQHTQSSGYLVAAGDAQTSVLVMRNATTDDTATELFLNGGTLRLVIPEETTWFVTVKVVGRQTDDDFTVYGLNWTGLLTRNSGGNATITNSTTVNEYLNDMAWSCAISANTTNQSLEILVQGGATDDINWVARVELVETFG